MRVGAFKIVFYYIDTDEIPGFFQWRKFSIQWRYNFHLSHVKISRLSWLLQSQPIGNYHHSIARVYTFFIHKSVVLKNKMKFSNALPNFDINIFDDEQNERIDGKFVCYYKVRQLFYYKVRQVWLQSATGITKCDDHYKVRQYGRRTSKPSDDLTERFGKTTAQECKKTSSARLTCVEQTNTTPRTRTGKFCHFSCPLHYHVTLLLSHRS